MTTRNQILEGLANLNSIKPVSEATDKEWDDFEKVVKADTSNKKLKQVCNKYRYDCDYAYKTSYGMIKFNIYAKDRSHSSYYPDIYESPKESLKAKPEFKISTVSYGSLVEAEYTKFLKACNDAYNLVHVLNGFDWDKLPVAPEDK